MFNIIYYLLLKTQLILYVEISYSQNSGEFARNNLFCCVRNMYIHSGRCKQPVRHKILCIKYILYVTLFFLNHDNLLGDKKKKKYRIFLLVVVFNKNTIYQILFIFNIFMLKE